MADRSVVVRLRAETGQYVAGLEQAKTATTKFGDEVQKRGKGARADIERVGTAGVVAGGLLLGALGGAAFSAANFEKAMSGVKSVSGASADEMKSLSDAALAAGASVKLAGVTAMDAADAEAELVKAGVSVADITGGALMGSLTLASAGQLDFANAATIAAQAMNIFHLQGSEVSHVADVLAAAANKSAGDVGQFGDALRQGGLVAAQTGLSLEDTVGALAAFADNALIGSDAGTSLKTMFQRLANPSGEAADLMKKLGISAYDAQGNFIGLEALAGQLHDGLKGLTQAQRDQASATIFGSDAVRAANILYQQGADGIKDYVDAVDDQGAASRMAAEANNNLKGDIDALGGAIQSALIENGSKATGALRAITQDATDFVGAFSSMPDIAQSATLGLGGLIGVTSLVGGGFVKMAPEIRASQTALKEMDSSLAKFAGRNMAGIATGIGALTAAISAGIWVYGEATKSSREYASAVDDLAASMKPVTEGQADLNQTVADFLELQSEGMSTEAISAMTALGVSVDDVQRSIREGGDALDPLREAVKTLGVDLKGIDLGDLDNVGPATVDRNSDALENLAKKLHVSKDALKELINTAEDWDGKAQDSAEKTVKAAEANGTFEGKAVDAAVAVNTAKDGTTNWVAVLDYLAPAMENVGDKATDAANGGLTDLTTAEADAEQKAKDLKTAIDNLLKPLDTQAATDKFTQGLHDWADGFKDAQDAVADAKKGLDDAEQRLRDRQADLNDLLATPVEDRGKDWQRRVNQAKRAVQDAKDAIVDAQGKVKDAVENSSKALDGNSDAALHNRDTLRQITEDATAAVEQAASDQTMSMDQVVALRDTMIQQIEDEAGKLGLSKEAVKQYIDVLKAIPLDITTKVKVEVSEADSLILRLFARNPDDPAKAEQLAERKVDPTYRAAGGPIYAAVGHYFQPRGTDSVPVMASPGEFMMQKKAVDRYGLAFMHAINGGRLQSANALPARAEAASRPSVVAPQVVINGPVTKRSVGDLVYAHQCIQARFGR